ncbi:MAG: C25 family cysteine peptidase, partial [Bacteroidales bacterium]|nr:C25 family cysteine peptidase [Bacteroidales bacterium]
MKNILLILFILISIQIQAQPAVLSTGSWHRITVSENGIYRIRYDDLVSRGVLNTPVPVHLVALFGGPNGAIPIENIPNETFDLQEIAVFLRDNNNDGLFGPGDYILFFGQSPHTWTWNTTQHYDTPSRHNHTNAFTNVMVYFLTTNFSGNGKRIENKPTAGGNPDVVITNFQDFFLHERDLVNPFRSSQEWYGERMDHIARTLDINDVHLPGLITDSAVRIITRVVVNEPAFAVMSSNNNHNRRDTLQIRRNRGNNVFMLDTIPHFFWNFTSERPRISFEYTRLSNNSSWMHLDYMVFHYRRRLSLEHTNIPLQFRSTDVVSGIGEFRISAANQTTQVWDISNPLNPQRINQTTSGNIVAFSANLSGIPEFIGFSDNHIRTITQFESVENQNFHAKENVEYVMVVHPNFREEAERLAVFHRSRNLNVLLISPQEVFNEFSYGRQDPMAIRRMMRHFRNKALAQNSDILPRYLLLFGSPSFDYRNITGTGQNFVLNYQFPTGLAEDQSLATDDFFGFLADGETGFNTNRIDSLRIGIGRFPVRTIEQARILVNKTIDYVNPFWRGAMREDQWRNVFGDWRNVVTNLADDGNHEFFVNTFESNRVGFNYFENDFRDSFPE